MVVPEVLDTPGPIPVWDAGRDLLTTGFPDWYPNWWPVEPETQMPVLEVPRFDTVPGSATAFDKRGKASSPESTLLHFYVADRKLRSQVTRPQRFVEPFSHFWGITAPDFSIRAGDPKDMRMIAVRLSRMVAAFYQSKGIRVVPHIRWCDSRDYSFCFLGVQSGSTVSVSTHGLWRHQTLRKSFLDGLNVLCERLSPPVLIVHGALPNEQFRTVAKKTQLIHFTDDRTRAFRGEV